MFCLVIGLMLVVAGIVVTAIILVNPEDGLGSVSDQWIAQHRSDSPWP